MRLVIKAGYNQAGYDTSTDTFVLPQGEDEDECEQEAPQHTSTPYTQTSTPQLQNSTPQRQKSTPQRPVASSNH